MKRKAKTLSKEELSHVEAYIDKHSKHPLRDHVLLNLSFKCGLRAMEMAYLSWSDVTKANGDLIPIGEEILLGSHITKGKKKETTIVMHPNVYASLEALKKTVTPKGRIAYAPQSRSGYMSPSNVTVYLYNLYKAAGLKGCSSHSGRRTFITNLARSCNKVGCSIKDVQHLARHSDIRTTNGYIDTSDKIRQLALQS